MCHRLCQRFYDGEIWRKKFEMVIEIEVEDLCTYFDKSNISKIHFFQFFVERKLNGEKKDIFVEMLRKMDENKILWVIDGFEKLKNLEYSKHCLPAKQLLKLLSNEQDFFKHLLLFSFPNGDAFPYPSLDLLGFKMDERAEKYIKLYFQKDISIVKTEKMEKLFLLLKHKNINQLANTPLFLQYLCAYIDQQVENNLAKNIAITPLYHALTNFLIEQYMKNISHLKAIFKKLLFNLSFHFYFENKNLFSFYQIRSFTLAYLSQGENEREEPFRFKEVPFIHSLKSNQFILQVEMAVNAIINCGFFTHSNNQFQFVDITFAEFFVSQLISNNFRFQKDFEKFFDSKKEQILKDGCFLIPFLSHHFSESEKVANPHPTNLSFKETPFLLPLLSFFYKDHFNSEYLNLKHFDNNAAKKIGEAINEIDNQELVIEFLSNFNQLWKFAILLDCFQPLPHLISLLIQTNQSDINSHKITPTPLHYLCQSKDVSLQMLQLLIEKKANLNSQNSSNHTPLHFICNNEKLSFENVKLLVESKAHLNITDNGGFSPFHFLCKNKNVSPQLITLFLEHKADMNLKSYTYGYTPLGNAQKNYNLISKLGNKSILKFFEKIINKKK